MGVLLDDYGELAPLGENLLAGVHAGTGRAWALKVLPGRLDRRTRAGIEAELRRLAPVAAGAPIVAGDRIVDLPDGRRALRRELLTQSLPELIEDFGPLSVPDAVALGSALAEALARARMVHGGVTPGNVLFRASGETVLTDFGVALRRAFPAPPDPAFRAPETIRDGVLDERADRYGLGAILYLALSGRAPFVRAPGEPDGDLVRRALTEPPPPIGRDDLPPGLSALVFELLAKDPGQRPADVRDRLAPPRTPSSRPAGTPVIEFGPRRRRRLPGPRVLGAATMVAVLVVVAALLVLSRPRDMRPPPAAAAGVSAPAGLPVRLELADPVDHGTVVDLSWTSGAGHLWYAVTVAGEGGRPTTTPVRRATSYRVAVDPVRRYCFKVVGYDSAGVYLSRPKAIRGATCVR